MKSCLYFGEVTHHRKAPKKHDLRYKLFMPHLFLDELDQVFRGRIFWSINRSNLSCFQRADYHKPETDSLEEAVRSTMNQQLGDQVEGPISVLTHLRTFGHCFNPVTFYYAWNDRRDRPTAVLAEITNTPWNERYAKAFQWTEKDRLSKHEFVKEFHVSPFIDMQVDYDWRFEKPSENLRVDMILRQSGRTFFSAHLNLRRRPINAMNLAWALARFPFLTMRISFGIYWNALLLRLKGCPFYSHPKHLEESSQHE
tara:strand:- start:92 stop:856 length:765 start_codon:yes stop_codon:yes gene_type:complete